MNINRDKSISAEFLPRGNGQLSQPASENEENQLLDCYLSLPENEREQEFLNTGAAAALVGVSRRTIQYWAEMGAIEAVFIGRKCRISAESLRAYLKRRANEHLGNGA